MTPEDEPPPGPAARGRGRRGHDARTRRHRPPRSSRAPRIAPTRLQLDAKGPGHDTYRGAAQDRPRSGPSREVSIASASTTTCGACCRRDAVGLAGRPRSAHRRSPPAAMRCAGSTRTPARSTCSTTPGPRSTWASRWRRTGRTRSSTAHPGAILVKGKHDRAINAFYHSTGGGATENNEYAFVGASGAVTAVAREVPARDQRRRRRRRRHSTRRRPTAQLEDRDADPRQAVRDLRQGRPDERRRPAEAQPQPARRVGPPVSRHAHRHRDRGPCRRRCRRRVRQRVYNAGRPVG